MSAWRLAAGACAFLALFFVEADAAAYCRARTCDPNDPKQSCQRDADDCIISGKLLSWSSRCVSFSVQEDGSPAEEIDADQLASVAESAFAAWTGIDCDGEAPSIEVQNLGPIACDVSQYNSNGFNANALIFRDAAWPYPGASDAYAFTRLRFDPTTGEIYDADIEINSADFDIALDSDGVDLQSILTHEAGHFFGLSHAADEDADATMSASWNGRGTELRSLESDDQAGLCAIYPPDRRAQSTSCEPRHGFASECSVPLPESESDDGGCSIAPARRPRSSALAQLCLVAAGAGLLGARARRRRTRVA